ncbi:MAG: 3-oxoacyl-ACP reductase FabG [Oscillospiraceae bacterium]|nr:3-oxoacyl-ACP reductase FabG [Oscillospiraceae bacterium]
MKTAFITGASRGIGRAIARQLALDGYRVGVNYLKEEEKANSLVAELRALGCEAMAVQADVSDTDAITRAIRAVEHAFSPVDLLVNNAGIAQQDLFQYTDAALWRRLFAVNVDGAYNTIQAVLPDMIARQSGNIVNISSMWGLRGASCEVGYSATKAAIIGLTRSLAMELAPSHIRVNCVAPGVIHTDMVNKLGEETIDALREQTPLGRLGTPEDIALAVAFLACDKASFITGQVLTADGGFIL